MKHGMDDKRTFFNNLAAGWDESFYKSELKERLPKLVSLFHLKVRSQILDVGSGTGGIIPYLLEAIGPRGAVRAVDFAQEMVRAGGKKFRGEDRVSFAAASVESLPFENGSFDHVVCFGAFPHFEEKRRALKEMGRVLRISGTLVIAHALSSAEIRHHHQNCTPVSHDFLPEESQMKDLLAQAGFQLKELIDRPKCYVCEAVKNSTGL